MSDAAQAVQKAVDEMKKQQSEGDKVKQTKAKAKTRARRQKATAAKPTEPRYAELPDSSELRLAPDGIRTDKGNRYVNIEFTNGFKLKLFPVGFKPSDVQKASAFVVDWLKNR